MKKQELLLEISKRSKVNFEQVENVMTAFKDIVIEQCSVAKSKVSIPKLGSFRGKLNKEKRAYSFKEKGMVTVPPSLTIKFKLFPSVTRKINKR